MNYTNQVEVVPEGAEINEETLASLKPYQMVVVMWWGKWDEGKWGDAYMLAENEYLDYELIISAVWGPNAWHETYGRDGRLFVWHNLPGAALTWKQVFLWQGKLIGIPWMIEEINELKNLDVKPRIKIASWAHCIFEWLQKRLDGAIEDFKSQNGNQVWTTKSWVWPAEALRAFRSSFTMWRLLIVEWEELETQVKELIAPFKEDFIFSYEEILSEILEHQKLLRDLIDDDEIQVEVVGDDYAAKSYKEWTRMLVEWSQSPSLWKFWWAYPNNTSTDTSFWWVMSSLLIEPTPDKVGKYVVAKVFPSAVWEHEFPEQMSKIVDKLLEKEKEYAVETGEKWSTTGRPRMVAFPSPKLLAEEADSPYTVAVSLRKLDYLNRCKSILEIEKLPIVVDYDENWSPIIEEIEFEVWSVIEAYRKTLVNELWEKGNEIPMILGYGPRPQDSRISVIRLNI